MQEGGWSREVTVRELPVSKSIAGVDMRLTAGGIRELHWHTAGEWAIMLYGSARITGLDSEGKSFVARNNHRWHLWDAAQPIGPATSWTGRRSGQCYG
jgi:oxalate decarboxylase